MSQMPDSSQLADRNLSYRVSTAGRVGVSAGADAQVPVASSPNRGWSHPRLQPLNNPRLGVLNR